METGLFAHLSADAGVAAIVGSKIYGGQVERGTEPPFLRFLRVGGNRLHSLDGPTGVSNPRMQVDCYASSYGAAKELAAAVRVSLDGFRGTMGTVTVGSSRIVGEQDFFEFDSELYRIALDFSFWHDE